MRRALTLRLRVANRSTGVLRAMETWLDRLPDFVMGDLREAVKSELLARDLPSIADESGGHLVVAPQGVH